ncbi:MAG: indolepyruvate oxidoreductase subunit beta, partial [FCB group bacterium]|nr:indolepyruvate oxidoreductase subunit beta [FCB group bacterium]
MHDVVNVVLAGLGGQGVIKASDILAEAAFLAGFDVKKSEIHGMSQRGGSVASDVRYGREVHSPMIPRGQAHYLVILERTQVNANRAVLREDGLLITPDFIPYFEKENEDGTPTTDRRMLNVAMLGVLSAYLDIPEEHWLAAVKANVPVRALEANIKVFQTGRTVEQALAGTRG